MCFVDTTDEEIQVEEVKVKAEGSSHRRSSGCDHLSYVPTHHGGGGGSTAR